MSTEAAVRFIRARPWLTRIVQPMSNWYKNAAGYRQIGLRADDLIPEENDVVQLALKRLTPKESYDRVFRIRRAVQCDITKHILPKHEWTKPEEDTLYLTPIIKQIQAELKEKDDLDVMVPKKPETI